ncbi:MAG: hypothetical protein U9R69_07020 [Thermodesulfobacteriota bacterium]|nr:hypothetical protein [Thermodesulfobacteriota bacterium]
MKKPVALNIGDLAISDPDLEILLGDLRRAGKQAEFIVASLQHYVKTAEGQSQFNKLIGLESIRKHDFGRIAGCNSDLGQSFTIIA